MATYIYAFIEFDDNTPPDLPPFTHDVSVWDLTWDLGFSTGKCYEFFAAIAGVRAEPGRIPLFPLRGLPPNVSDAARKELVELDSVSWLFPSEIEQAMDHAGFDRRLLNRSGQFVVRTLRSAADVYGPDRVRLVFGFD